MKDYPTNFQFLPYSITHSFVTLETNHHVYDIMSMICKVLAYVIYQLLQGCKKLSTTEGHNNLSGHGEQHFYGVTVKTVGHVPSGSVAYV